MTWSVWANITDVPNWVCSDARLRGQIPRSGLYGAFVGPESTTGGTTDNWWGQAGWDQGMHFDDLADLGHQLAVGAPFPAYTGRSDRTIAPGDITKLALCTHGEDGGVIRIDRESRPGCSPQSFDRFVDRFAAVFRYLR